ncbi:MAG: helix-turn-helix transcriptional regulator [Clostridium perfringens]|nr:helix-turn-helix transcriptional regulator [Clostridium perfringens]
MTAIEVVIKEKNISYSEVASKIGYSVAYVQMLAKGKRKNPSMKVLKKLSTVLEVSIDNLVNKEDK